MLPALDEPPEPDAPLEPLPPAAPLDDPPPVFAVVEPVDPPSDVLPDDVDDEPLLPDVPELEPEPLELEPSPDVPGLPPPDALDCDAPAASCRNPPSTYPSPKPAASNTTATSEERVLIRTRRRRAADPSDMGLSYPTANAITASLSAQYRVAFDDAGCGRRRLDAADQTAVREIERREHDQRDAAQDRSQPTLHSHRTVRRRRRRPGSPTASGAALPSPSFPAAREATAISGATSCGAPLSRR